MHGFNQRFLNKPLTRAMTEYLQHPVMLRAVAASITGVLTFRVLRALRG